MEKLIYQEKTGRQLIDTLESMADGVEEMVYGVRLDDQELADNKTRFAQISILEARIADEKKAFMEELKARLKPIIFEKSGLLQIIKTGMTEQEGKVFKFIDHDTKMAGFYNDRGQLVYARGANTDELSQLTIAHNVRTGTNN
ncbi:MAG: hypothetical protein Q8N05_16650 [Bacteroidota bacterium]|nr:hypothetical protein [Bacteroidota bacterium]